MFFTTLAALGIGIFVAIFLSRSIAAATQSERTAQANIEIAAMIGSIQSEARSSVDAMQLGTREVEVGVEKTSASGVALEQIIRMSESVGD